MDNRTTRSDRPAINVINAWEQLLRKAHEVAQTIRQQVSRVLNENRTEEQGRRKNDGAAT